MVALRSMCEHIAAHILWVHVTSEVRLLLCAHLHTCAAAGAGEVGQAADRRVVQRPILQPPTIVKLCAHPNFYGKYRCTNCPAHCPICMTMV
jgi:hypothetical protein